MQYYVQQILNALQVGSVYALIALGYTMVYGILTLINFAHGDIFMAAGFMMVYLSASLPVYVALPLVIIITVLLGFVVERLAYKPLRSAPRMFFMVSTYIAFFVSTLLLGLTHHLPPLFTFVATMLAAMAGTSLVAVLIERLAYKPLRTAPRISCVITALGVGLLLENFMVAFKPIGPDSRIIPALFESRNYSIAGVTFSTLQIMIILISGIAMVLLDLVVRKTMIGMAMRAISWDKFTVPLMGISVDTIISITFILGASVAAIGGTLYGMAYSIDPYMGIRIGWWAFISAVVGGIGNIRGAMLGGYILGFIEIFTPVFLPTSTYRDFVAFSLLLVLLIFKPTGILGKPAVQKV
jgi:branched-chain amino acid transport system permease protein